MARSHWLVAIALIAGFARTAVLHADEAEVRSYRIDVGTQRAGEVKIQFHAKGDGSTVAEVQTVRQTKLSAGWSRFGYHGIETWKDGRLQRFDSALDDDGKKRRISASPLDGKLRVTVNDHRHDIAARAWTTTFCILPTNVQRRQTVAMLDVVTGSERSGRLEYIGVEKVTAAEQAMNCAHYRLQSSGLNAELWFDGLDRLVRAEIAEDNRQWTMELTGLARNNESAVGKRQ